MPYIYILLAQMIRKGEVRVDIPGLDMDQLRAVCAQYSERLLQTVRGVVFDEEGSDTEKLDAIKRLLAEQ